MVKILNEHAQIDGTADRIVNSIREDFDYRVDSSGRRPQFFVGERVFVGPLNMEATVVRQILHYDGSESFWGNLELIYDDGTRGTSNSWQCRKIEVRPHQTNTSNPIDFPKPDMTREDILRMAREAGFRKLEEGEIGVGKGELVAQPSVRSVQRF